MFELIPLEGLLARQIAGDTTAEALILEKFSHAFRLGNIPVELMAASLPIIVAAIETGKLPSKRRRGRQKGDQGRKAVQIAISYLELVATGKSSSAAASDAAENYSTLNQTMEVSHVYRCVANHGQRAERIISTRKVARELLSQMNVNERSALQSLRNSIDKVPDDSNFT